MFGFQAKNLVDTVVFKDGIVFVVLQAKRKFMAIVHRFREKKRAGGNFAFMMEQENVFYQMNGRGRARPKWSPGSRFRTHNHTRLSQDDAR